MFNSKRDLTAALAMASAVLPDQGRPMVIRGEPDPITAFYSRHGVGGGWSGSFRGKRPAGLTKAQRAKKRKAQRLERQRRGELDRHRNAIHLKR